MVSQSVEYSEAIALAGLEQSWELGDKLALIECVALCAENNWSYPNWVSDLIGSVMISLYRSIYPTDNLNRTSLGKTTLPEINKTLSERASKFQDEKAGIMKLLGWEIERDNIINLRSRILRDAYLAEAIATRSTLVLQPTPHFTDVNAAIEILLETLADDSPALQNLPSECLGASDSTVWRAWMKHKKQLAAFHAKYPEEVDTSLAWFLFPTDAPK